MGRVYRTDRLTGRPSALLAHDRQKIRPNRGIFILPLTFNSDPMHCPPAHDLPQRRYGYVVLCMAGDDTGSASRALIQVDRHGPFTIWELSHNIPPLFPWKGLIDKTLRDAHLIFKQRQLGFLTRRRYLDP